MSTYIQVRTNKKECYISFLNVPYDSNTDYIDDIMFFNYSDMCPRNDFMGTTSHYLYDKNGIEIYGYNDPRIYEVRYYLKNWPNRSFRKRFIELFKSFWTE